jgi:hypothetical protein
VRRGDSSERRVRMVVVVLLVRQRVTVVGSDGREVVLVGVDSLAGCDGTSLDWHYPLYGDKSSISKAKVNIEQFLLNLKKRSELSQE